MLKSRFLALLILGFSSLAHAHGGTSSSIEADEALRRTLLLFERITELAPEVTDPSLDIAAPRVKISGELVYLNGPFWQLVQGWVRLYYSELQEECDQCLPMSEDQFAKLAQDEIAQSFFQKKVGRPLQEGLSHVLNSSADIGARLGTTAFVAKLTAEVAETVLSKMAFMGGFHLFCYAIDALIVFSTRHVQSAARVVSWSSVFDSSKSLNALRMGWVSRVVRRAQRRVVFETGPVSVNEQLLREVDLEGPNRLWGWAKKGKRAKWVERLVRRQSEGRSAPNRSAATLSRPEFLGGRMKRYLFLKGRQRGHSQFMKGTTPMDQTLGQSVLWILSVQESILQRSLIKVGEEPALTQASLAATRTLASDEIRRGLAEEFAAHQEEADFIENLLKDVEVVFNPHVPSKVRYFHATSLESLLSGFMGSILTDTLDHKARIHGEGWSAMLQQFKMHWRFGRFGNYLYQWADFLRLASLQSDSEELMRNKYEAMEALLRVFRYFRKMQALGSAESLQDLMGVEEELSSEYRRLKSFQPWQGTKTIHYSWNPFSNAGPACYDMNKAVDL